MNMMSWIPDLPILIILGVAVLQIPLLIDILDNCFPSRRVGRFLHRGFSVFLVVLLIAMGIVSLWMFYNVFLPFSEHSVTIDLQYTLIRYMSIPLKATLATWVWFMMMSHYIASVILSPDWTKRTKSIDEQVSVSIRGHCCNVCHSSSSVDHHCPFTTQCVGERNFINFFACLCYSVCGFGIAILFSAPPFFACWLNYHHNSVVEVANLTKVCEDLSLNNLGLLFVPVATMFMATSSILFFHVFLLIVDKRTWELLRTFRRSTVNTETMTSWKSGLQPGSRLRVWLLGQEPDGYKRWPWWAILLPPLPWHWWYNDNDVGKQHSI